MLRQAEAVNEVARTNVNIERKYVTLIDATRQAGVRVTDALVALSRAESRASQGHPDVILHHVEELRRTICASLDVTRLFASELTDHAKDLADVHARLTHLTNERKNTTDAATYADLTRLMMDQHRLARAKHAPPSFYAACVVISPPSQLELLMDLPSPASRPTGPVDTIMKKRFIRKNM